MSGSPIRRLPTPPSSSAVRRRRVRRPASDRTWLQPEMQRLKGATLAYSLAAGNPVRSSTVSLVLSAKELLDDPLDVWTVEIVEELLWNQVLVCCEMADKELPLDVPEALWAIVGAACELANQPAAARVLREPLVAAGGLTAQGTRRRHPSRTGTVRRR